MKSTFKYLILVVCVFPIILVAEFVLEPRSPCACITQKMMADRLFMLDSLEAKSSDLKSALSKKFYKNQDYEEVLKNKEKFNMWLYNRCDSSDNKKIMCQFVIYETIFTKKTLNLILEFNDKNKVSNINVLRISS